MVGNWRERKESGVDTTEGTIKVSVLKAVLFLWRVFNLLVIVRHDMGVCGNSGLRVWLYNPGQHSHHDGGTLYGLASVSNVQDSSLQL